VFAITLAIVSRRLELAILAKYGLHSHLHYAQYIKVCKIVIICLVLVYRFTNADYRPNLW
jgi:hypothetical protein